MQLSLIKMQFVSHFFCNLLMRFDFDTMLVPVNPAEASYNSFLEETMPLAAQKAANILLVKTLPASVRIIVG